MPLYRACPVHLPAQLNHLLFELRKVIIQPTKGFVLYFRCALARGSKVQLIKRVTANDGHHHFDFV